MITIGMDPGALICSGHIGRTATFKSEVESEIEKEIILEEAFLGQCSRVLSSNIH